MARNGNKPKGNSLSVSCTQPATPKSGDPVLFGDLPGIAQTTEDANGKTSVKFDGSANIPVKGINAGGNSAVAEGDVLYYTAGDTPPVSKKNTGTRFGVALGTGTVVTSGSTSTIEVRVGY